MTFAGTALLAPLIIAAVLTPRPPGVEIVIATAMALLVFLCSLFGVVPVQIGQLRLDLLLLLLLSAFTGFVVDRSSRVTGIAQFK